MLESITVSQEALEAISEAGGESVKECFQCGLCNTVCPWNLVKDFMVRKLIREAQLGVTELKSESIWQCATCGSCVVRCPRGVKITDVTLAVRRIAAEYNALPQSLRVVRAGLNGEGNPWGGKREERADWAKDLAVKAFTEDTEVLYFPCCAQAYDPRTRKIAIATVKILQKAGVDFGIIGTEGVCCGESARKAGLEEQFKRLARENSKTFIDKGVKKILVSSPHCFETLRNEYPEFMVNFEVMHVSTFLAELIKSGKLHIRGEYRRKVTYHDPCYLGRHNGIYDAPREILRQIPGLELVEMASSKEDSLCCGGGGARIWMETPRNERLSDLRVVQAVESGASVLATFCPYCILNFEDSRSNLPENINLEVKDITEIIQDLI